ncbi:MAG: M23 family metallopeptidase [Pseudomonadota bacterium]
MRLLYLRKVLVLVEEKEKMLRTHFGLEKIQSLNQIIGGGGEISIHLPKEGFGHEDQAHEIPLPLKLRTLVSNFEVINHLTIKQKELWEKTPCIVPLSLKKPKISSRFGWRKNPITDRDEFHAGIDILGPKGTRIIAPAFGTVTRKGYDPWLGNYLLLEHKEEMKTVYGHLEKVVVEKGTKVERGETIGLLGNTGMSTCHHLHYGIVIDNRAVDPLQFMLDINKSS